MHRFLLGRFLEWLCFGHRSVSRSRNPIFRTPDCDTESLQVRHFSAAHHLRTAKWGCTRRLGTCTLHAGAQTSIQTSTVNGSSGEHGSSLSFTFRVQTQVRVKRHRLEHSGLLKFSSYFQLAPRERPADLQHCCMSHFVCGGLTASDFTSLRSQQAHVRDARTGQPNQVLLQKFRRLQTW